MGRKKKIDKTRTRNLNFFNGGGAWHVVFGTRNNAICNFARIPPQAFGKYKRDIRCVITVIGILGMLERDLLHVKITNPFFFFELQKCLPEHFSNFFFCHFSFSVTYF